ncbi:MAG: ATP-binding protein [Phycisphaerales bacterium]|nr:ATP-binding protein [Phycisphaerales bacterium]
MVQSGADRDRELAKKIRSAKPGDAPFRETLRTSERVLRRVTDGIYREPWAAIRELISNAYDADATRVIISTDAPRFQRLTIRDNGNGFTAEALAAMCHNIGGSPKRTLTGANLGVTAKDDPNLSPSGRRLIGKLGIGLFSVSQLTQQFRIITKVKGEKSRTIADVVLYRYSEPRKQHQPVTDEVETTGEVLITKVAAEDADAHGTDVIIDHPLPRTRDEFQSRNIWELILNPPSDAEGEESVVRPICHIGYIGPKDDDTYQEKPVLPWANGDNPLTRFKKLTQAMFVRADQPGVERRPSLISTFDNYLRFVWLIALSAPIDYLEKHPFDIGAEDGVRVFRLGAMKVGKAEEIKLKPRERVRDRLKLRAPERGGLPEFTVLMDDLELRRPIRFTGLPRTTNKLTTPLLFVGSDEPNMSKFDPRVTGGPLQFEGYLLWSPRVVPVEHNGALIRIGDSSGSLFDQTFMRYQISEQTRKEQVSAEIFVHDGMDAALNIDRESFNHSHPHYQYLTAWMHDAFKQFATKHKSLGSETRMASTLAGHAKAREKLEELAENAVSRLTDNEETPVEVRFVDHPELFSDESKKEVVVLPSSILKSALGSQRSSKQNALEYTTNEAKMAAIIQILYAAGVLDKLSRNRREKLLADIAAVVFFRGAE